jgi:hypothetical protein
LYFTYKKIAFAVLWFFIQDPASNIEDREASSPERVQDLPVPGREGEASLEKGVCKWETIS